LGRVASVLAHPRIEHYKTFTIIDVKGFEKRGWQQTISDPPSCTMSGFPGNRISVPLKPADFPIEMRARTAIADSRLKESFPAPALLSCFWTLEQPRAKGSP